METENVSWWPAVTHAARGDKFEFLTAVIKKISLSLTTSCRMVFCLRRCWYLHAFIPHFPVARSKNIYRNIARPTYTSLHTKRQDISRNRYFAQPAGTILLKRQIPNEKAITFSRACNVSFRLHAWRECHRCCRSSSAISGITSIFRCRVWIYRPLEQFILVEPRVSGKEPAHTRGIHWFRRHRSIFLTNDWWKG